jgi:hypothetical protein
MSYKEKSKTKYLDSKNQFEQKAGSHLDIPQGTKSIDEGKYSSKGLTSVIIPNSVTDIGIGAFSTNELTSVIIPDSVTSIGDGAFNNNKLTSIKILDTVTSIGRNAFSENKLTSVTIGNKITSINTGTFYDNQLTNVVIPDSVTSIGDGAFFGNKLTSLKIPDFVTGIGQHSFSFNKLTSVTIPDSVTSIDNDAFSNNESTLKSVTIPAIFNTNEHKKRIFGDKYNTRNIIYTSKHLKIISGTISIDNKKYNSMGLLSLEIPHSVISIGDGAFQNNQLTCVTIPDSVTSIGDGAFYENKLTSVTIGNKVTSISNNSFRNNKLESVTILESVTNIGFGAFAVNKLKSVTIPDSVTSIDDHAFTQNELTSVIMPDRFNTNKDRTRIFGEKYNIRNIFFNKHLEISQGTTIISDNAYQKMQLKSLKIPNSVTYIGDLAFFRNEITNVEIPDSVTSIGDDTFARNQLTSVTIGKKVTSIGDGAFAFNQLTSVIIPNSVTSIGESAFANNQLLGSVTIGQKVTRIDDRAFINNNLISVTISDKFNNDTEKARIFGSDFTKIIFTLLSVNPNNDRLFPIVAPVNLVEEHSIFDTIENELKNFGLNIQLGTVSELRDQFKNLVDDPLNFATFKEGVVDASGSKTIELNRAYSDGTIEKKIFTFNKHLSAGSFNTTDIYIDKNSPNNKEYIFRSSTSTTFEDQFKSFYENLKHIILYIIIRKRLGNIKFIPQPYHFGVKKDTTTGQITLYMIMEKGKATLEDYIKNTNLTADQIKKLVFSIYCDLYELSFLCMKDGDISTLLKFKHNDFKCNNLVVSESGSPLIIDFGFSQFILSDAGRSIKFVSCEAIKSMYYKSGPNGFNVIHDMLQLIASFNLINKRGFKPFEILKFTNNPGSNILDTNVIVSLISNLYGTQSVDSPTLFRQFYSTFDLNIIYTSKYTIEITPSELANNIGLNLADRIIDTFEKKYRKYKMKYLKLVAKLTKS